MGKELLLNTSKTNIFVVVFTIILKMSFIVGSSILLCNFFRGVLPILSLLSYFF